MNSIHLSSYARTAHPQRSKLYSSDNAKLVLIRGLPGSGKSTMARVLALVGYEHYEADQFFEREGVYAFDGSLIQEAHAWCRQQTRHALNRGCRVVVSNTFTRSAEMQPYIDMTSHVRIIEATGRWPNVHGVPEQKLREMARRWESV